MSYLIKVGDENTEVPHNCDECWCCIDTYAICESCKIAETLSKCNNIPVKVDTSDAQHEYYCTANCNQVLNYKEVFEEKPNWCPIQKEQTDE